MCTNIIYFKRICSSRYIIVELPTERLLKPVIGDSELGNITIYIITPNGISLGTIYCI